MEAKEFADKVRRGEIELKLPQSEGTPDPQYQKQGSEWVAILLLACAAFGCALAALILALGK
jgi:hypothetical protein